MSQQNVETVERFYADAAATAWRDVDADQFAEYFHPDVEMVPRTIYPDIEPFYRGREGLQRFQRQPDEIWDDFRFEAERFFDAHDHVVFAQISRTGKQCGARSRFLLYTCSRRGTAASLELSYSSTVRRRCGRRACQDRGQVPVSGVGPRGEKAQRS
jgi:ketosteroid isomerase-like protein